jgi:hypothetical protein
MSHGALCVCFADIATAGFEDKKYKRNSCGSLGTEEATQANGSVSVLLLPLPAAFLRWIHGPSSHSSSESAAATATASDNNHCVVIMHAQCVSVSFCYH